MLSVNDTNRWIPLDVIYDINFGFGNGLMPSGNMPLSKPMLTQTCFAYDTIRQ